MTVEHLRLAKQDPESPESDLDRDRDSLDATEPEDDRLCSRCGHALDYHRTASRRCTFELMECPFCGGKLLSGWHDEEPARCTNRGCQIDARCGCDLALRIVE